MGYLIFFILVVVVVVIIKKFGLSFLRRGSESEEERLPYFKKNYLLTRAESSFFRILEQAVENRYYIFPQVHLSELLLTKAKREDYYKYLNKINRKSVDFVIAEKNYLSPLLAIELDDSTHNYDDRKKRDYFVEDVFKDAGLPLLRVRTSLSYNVQQIKTMIEEKISGKKEVTLK